MGNEGLTFPLTLPNMQHTCVHLTPLVLRALCYSCPRPRARFLACEAPLTLHVSHKTHLSDGIEIIGLVPQAPLLEPGFDAGDLGGVTAPNDHEDKREMFQDMVSHTANPVQQNLRASRGGVRVGPAHSKRDASRAVNVTLRSRT